MAFELSSAAEKPPNLKPKLQTFSFEPFSSKRCHKLILIFFEVKLIKRVEYRRRKYWSRVLRSHWVMLRLVRS